MAVAPKDLNNYFQGFSKLNRKERLARLQQMGALSQSDIKFLTKSSGLEVDLAEHLIENVIGYFHMPLGIATNFKIDGQYRVIPMAVEETSIIAAASKTARWVDQNGSINTTVLGHLGIGQIQFAVVNDFENFKKIILLNEHHLIEKANREVAPSMTQRGGGVKKFSVRSLERPDGKTMGVIHVYIDTCEAMGANIINQICEFLKEPIEQLTNEQCTMCILSNLVDSKLYKATVVVNDVEPELGAALQEASLFANLDPYRAATNNKGIMNGIDPLLIATGNDWRAVEAGIHAYACREGRYQSISHWKYEHENQQLIGELIVPLQIGVIGGVTRLHPCAQLALRILNVSTADELAKIIAAVGLVQNLGAIKALCTDGIIQGHMRLHITNLSIGAGASGGEIAILQRRLEELLTLRKRISLSHAKQILQELRELRATGIATAHTVDGTN